jgi:2-oxoglutarate dehydrogenase E2 component (dihydrolipoamide succinyltransferase)
MKHPVKAPSVGESITEVSILKWAKQNGQQVKVGDLLLELESDKATVEIVAEAAGQLQILKQAGERLPIGETMATIDDSATGSASAGTSTGLTPPPLPGMGGPRAVPPASPSLGMGGGSMSSPTPPPRSTSLSTAPSGATAAGAPMPGPAARKALSEAGLDASQLSGSGKDGRVTKADVAGYQAKGPSPAPTAPSVATAKPGERRVAMSMLRQRIAERLVQAQHTAAILTTFNEADMSAIMKLRSQHKDAFKAKHGVSLGFMSFFTRASVEALKVVPEVNAYIDGHDVLYHDYYDIGIAVGSDRGLVVPVLRDAGKMGFVEIEKGIAAMAEKAKVGKLSIAELSGGTFTISNGGVYGSLLSTPILNPPQSGILGMHKIMDRPIVVDGKIEARPMMYLALSYDHRIIDGKGAVTFLVTLKDFLEHPEKLGLEY